MRRDRAELAPATPRPSPRSSSARNEEQPNENLGAVGWNLTLEQVAKLVAAGDRPRAYPYWHQLQFREREPLV